MKKLINTLIFTGLVASTIPAQANVMDTIKSGLSKTYNTLTSRTAMSLYALGASAVLFHEYLVKNPHNIAVAQKAIQDITASALALATPLERFQHYRTGSLLHIDFCNVGLRATQNINQLNTLISFLQKIEPILLGAAAITGTIGTAGLVLG